MSEKLKAGDVVQLRSGGPLMTVLADECDLLSMVECAWFPGELCELQRATLPPAALRLAAIELHGPAMKYRAKGELEPVGMDFDGQVKSLEQLEIKCDEQALAAKIRQRLEESAPEPRGGFF